MAISGSGRKSPGAEIPARHHTGSAQVADPPATAPTLSTLQRGKHSWLMSKDSLVRRRVINNREGIFEEGNIVEHVLKRNVQTLFQTLVLRLV